MSDAPKRIRLFAEGDQDRAVLNGLSMAGLLGGGVEVSGKADRTKRTAGEPEEGISRLLYDAGRFAAIPGTEMIVVRDFDQLDADGMKQWLLAGIKKQPLVDDVDNAATALTANTT